MRVLQVISTLKVGGAQQLLVNLAGRLRRAGHDVRAVAVYAASGSALEAQLGADGVPVEFLGKERGVDPRMIPRLARVLAAHRPDVVHTHMGVLKYLFPAAAARRIPVVHTVHNLAEREVERPSQLLQGLAFRMNVVPVAIGEAVAESVRRVYRLRRCRVIPNGIPLAEYAPPAGARERLRRELGIPDDAPTFVAVGRLEPQKDHATLLRAFASPRLAAAGARLLVAGDGGLREELERLAHAAGAGERVVFLGTRSDVPGLLAAADAFVLASRWEGNPLAVMEAMAAGKAVIATAVGCVPELVPEDAGRLVAAGDAAALEAALHELAAAPALARRRGEAAAGFAALRFDLAETTRAYEAVYAEAGSVSTLRYTPA